MYAWNGSDKWFLKETRAVPLFFELQRYYILGLYHASMALSCPQQNKERVFFVKGFLLFDITHGSPGCCPVQHQFDICDAVGRKHFLHEIQQILRRISDF